MNQNIFQDILFYVDECSFTQIQKQIFKKHKFYITKQIVLQYYLNELYHQRIYENSKLEQLLRIKPTRSNSGELEITTILPPHKFSCKYDCAMCPNEPNQPRSYLSSEGTPKLGIIEKFDVKYQIWRRLIQLEYLMGHNIDKIIHILLGGTFHSFPQEIIDNYIHELYYACNVYYIMSLRKNGKLSSFILEWLKLNPYLNKISLKESLEDIFLSYLPTIQNFETEKFINTYHHYGRITGIVIETRPDQINVKEMIRLRKYGVTRVQLGVQHNDINVLEIINRKHSIECSEKAIRYLKDNGFKIDIHLLLDCPGTTLEKDYQLCQFALTQPNILADYIKLYICVDVPFTKIRKYKENKNKYRLEHQQMIQNEMIQGNFKQLVHIFNKPLDDILIWNSIAESNYPDFFIMLQKIVQLIPTFIRLNRFHRDFPLAKDAPMQLGYESETLKTNLQQLCMETLEKKGIYSNDIRAREIRNEYIDLHSCYIYIKSYQTFGGLEYFISIESPVSSYLNSKIIGMIRCRITDYDVKNTETIPSWFLPIFHTKSLRIRELHVYGNLQSKSGNNNGQHRGIGKLLLHIAEQLALYYQLKQIVIISGVGVQNYYYKSGYTLDYDTEYMYKNTNNLHLSNYFKLCFDKIVQKKKNSFPILFKKIYSNPIDEKLFVVKIPILTSNYTFCNYTLLCAFLCIMCMFILCFLLIWIHL